MRKEVIATHDGRTQPVSVWAAEFGITPKAMQRRIDTMPSDRAFASPLYGHEGTRQRLGDWATELGISRTAMRFRLERWPLDIALTKPRGLRGPRYSKEVKT